VRFKCLATSAKPPPDVVCLVSVAISIRIGVERVEASIVVARLKIQE
jgi:hypothetical protein